MPDFKISDIFEDYLPFSILIIVRMFEAVTFVTVCVDIFPIYPVATAVIAESVCVKYDALMITTIV